MEDTLYDLVIGNIDESSLHIFSAGWVVTRPQAKQEWDTYRKLKVPDQIQSEAKEALITG